MPNVNEAALVFADIRDAFNYIALDTTISDDERKRVALDINTMVDQLDECFRPCDTSILVRYHAKYPHSELLDMLSCRGGKVADAIKSLV